MNSTHGLKTNRFSILFIALISVAPFFSSAQQKLKTTDFVLYGKKVTMASTITVKKGLIGATRLIQTTGGVTFGAISRLIVAVFTVTVLLFLPVPSRLTGL